MTVASPTTATLPTVFVVDDDASFRPAIARSLRAAGHAVETFPSATEFLARIQADPAATGCALIDLHMPGKGGLELQTALAACLNPLPIVFLSGQGDIPSSVLAIRNGAEDFLTKLAPKAALLAAIERAIARDARERTHRAQNRAALDRFGRLTPREHEVLVQVLGGALNKQIAAALGIDERSVKRHRTSFMRKLEVASVARLVELAHRVGYPSPKGR